MSCLRALQLIFGSTSVLAAQSPIVDPVVQQAYVKASNPDVQDNFSRHALAISGDTIVIGSLFEDSNAVGVDGDESNDSANNAGAAYVFVRQGTTWIQQAYLKASNPEVSDLFGAAVAISGDTIAVAATGEAGSSPGVNGDQSDNSLGDAGAVYVFVRSGGSWAQQAYLKASNPAVNDRFGRSLALDGDTLVVGAPFEDSGSSGVDADQGDNSAGSAGAAYVFVRDATTWSQQAYLKASNAGAGDEFGLSVDIEGDTVVVGATDEDGSAGIDGPNDNTLGDSGAAYVFVRSGETWTQQAYLKASNRDSGDLFGRAVGVSGDTVCVGAPLEGSSATGIGGDELNNSAQFAGAVYVFERSGSAWSQQAYLKASNTDPEDIFGEALALDGEVLVVGARGEDSSARGVDGAQDADFDASGAGAAYAFVRESGVWSQGEYLKASNTQAADSFGEAVAVGGGTVVVGALGEDSNANRVNGSQGNNGLDGAGAAYVFALAGSGCPRARIPTLSGRPSFLTGFTVSCPGMTRPCSGPRMAIFGTCAPALVPVEPPIGCSSCTLGVLPAVGALSDSLVVCPGLPIGFTFCVQCGCIASTCIELSAHAEIVVVL